MSCRNLWLRTLLPLFTTGLFFSAPVLASSIEEFGKGLDLSILDAPATDETTSPEIPALHLFSAFESAPRPVTPELGSDLQLMTFPKGTTLVVPNAPRVDEAYRRLGDVVTAKKLTPSFPLKVILHADGNVSVGCGLNESLQTALPPGVDISPQKRIQMLGTLADAQLAERSHPPVVTAVVSIRNGAKERGLDLDTSEIYFLPIEPGKVWVGLKLRQQVAKTEE